MTKMAQVFRVRVLLITAFGVACVQGCETLTSDVADMVEGMTPRSPSEVGRMAVDPHDPDNRREGTMLLANAYFGGADAHLAMYREYVQYDRDPLVKAAAIKALARHGSPEDAVLISVQLANESSVVRWEAAKGLQRLHSPIVVPDLLAALRNPDEEPWVRVAAAEALGQYAEDRVFHALVAGLNARELSLNLTAQKSLKTLTGEDFGLDAAAWLDWHGAAQAAGDPFAGQREYLFPTFRRNERWWERIAFWATHEYEEPAPPAGLPSASARSTYEEAPPADDGADGDG